MAIEAIYRTRHDPDAYLAYVNSLGEAAGRTEDQKEEVYFSSAEQIFLSGDYAKAQTTLQSYLERYPEAAYAAKAKFYLAECNREAGNKEQAMDLYHSMAWGLGTPRYRLLTIESLTLAEIGTFQNIGVCCFLLASFSKFI